MTSLKILKKGNGALYKLDEEIYRPHLYVVNIEDTIFSIGIKTDGGMQFLVLEEIEKYAFDVVMKKTIIENANLELFEVSDELHLSSLVLAAEELCILEVASDYEEATVVHNLNLNGIGRNYHGVYPEGFQTKILHFFEQTNSTVALLEGLGKKGPECHIKVDSRYVSVINSDITQSNISELGKFIFDSICSAVDSTELSEA